MKKTAYFLTILTISMSHLQGCNNSTPDHSFDLEAMQKIEVYESIMDGEKRWKLGSVISDIPREYVYTEFNTETFEFDTTRSVSTDWLSQMPACRNDDPFTLNYLGGVDLYGESVPDNIHIRLESGIGEQCSDIEDEHTFYGSGSSVVKFDQYKMRLSAVHDRFYGYTITSTNPQNEEDKQELWTNFKATPDLISYEVDKKYKSQVYQLKVTLVPF